MPSPLSVDLRQRVGSTVSEGASCHQPDFNPIGQIFAKLKGPLRTAAARTVPDLRHTIRRA